MLKVMFLHFLNLALFITILPKWLFVIRIMLLRIVMVISELDWVVCIVVIRMIV